MHLDLAFATVSLLLYGALFLLKCTFAAAVSSGVPCALLAPDIFHFVPVMLWGDRSAGFASFTVVLAMAVAPRGFFCQSGLSDIEWGFTYVALGVLCGLYLVFSTKEENPKESFFPYRWLLYVQALYVTCMFLMGIPVGRAVPSPFYPVFTTLFFWEGALGGDEDGLLTFGLFMLFMVGFIIALASFILGFYPSVCFPYNYTYVFLYIIEGFIVFGCPVLLFIHAKLREGKAAICRAARIGRRASQWREGSLLQ